MTEQTLDWFSIEKYTQNRPSPEGMFRAILSRPTILELPGSPEYQELILQNLHGDPWAAAESPWPLTLPQRPYGNTCVELLTNLDLRFLNLRNRDIEHAALPGAFVDSNAGADPDYLHVKIRRDADPRIISEEILSLLKLLEARKHGPKLQPESVETILEKCWRYRVVPFLDLRIWAQITQREVSNEFIARRIFPDRPVSADSIRKTTKKYATLVQSENFTYTAKAYFGLTAYAP